MRYASRTLLAANIMLGMGSGFRPFIHVRRQMPVGQGGFHVGALAVWPPHGGGESIGAFSRPEYLYVYDCGSEPKKLVNREINALLAACPHRHLDLLVLSHFDRDHICGTPHLLRSNGGFSVDTILLPFVAMDERIVALAQAVAETRENGGRIDRFFVDMVFDPIGTLAAFGPRRIILVRGDGDDDARLDGEATPDFDPSGPEARPDTKERRAAAERGGIETLLVDAYGDPQRPPYHAHAGGAAGVEVVEVRNMALAISDNGHAIEWKLLPWVRSAAAGDIASFRTKVETLLGWPAGTFATKVLDPAVRRQMVTTRRTELAAAYKQAFGDKNLTSLCLYSGPRFPDLTEAAAVLPAMGGHRLTKIGWLGTGDAHLKDAADIAAFRHAYRKEIDLVSTYVFPHHGSIENSDAADLIVSADLWIAAADPIHDWAHPHWSLQQAVDTMGKRFHQVKGWPDTAAEETFWVIANP